MLARVKKTGFIKVPYTLNARPGFFLPLILLDLVPVSSISPISLVTRYWAPSRVSTELPAITRPSDAGPDF